jgi:hypothetical protein
LSQNEENSQLKVLAVNIKFFINRKILKKVNAISKAGKPHPLKGVLHRQLNKIINVEPIPSFVSTFISPQAL